jgi:hypothetical protein
MPGLDEVERLRAKSHRLRAEARALDVQATEAMSAALAAVPAGTRLDYTPSPPDYSVTLTEAGWVDPGGNPVHAEWVETYWARGSLRLHRADGDSDA